MQPTKATLTLGPILFHWPEETWRDFYFQIADEAPVDTVYIGETVCAKRAPFTMPYYDEVMTRLENAGKVVVFSTLGEVAVPLDRKQVASICSLEDHLIEANDVSALWQLGGRPHVLGPLMNIYNEDALTALARRGAVRACLPSELPAKALENLSRTAANLDIGLEVQVFGRTSLALSARCYHARAHNRVKDSCLFVCEKDPDGMDLQTLDGKSFLAVNGIQTLSHACLNLVQEIPELIRMGIRHFRLSPHSCHMVEIAHLYRGVIDNEITASELIRQLSNFYPAMPPANCFYHGRAGHEWLAA